jgi:RNA polymerase sigma factor (TIGR02999 family)
MPENPRDLTDLLAHWRSGDREAGNQLMEAVYQNLERMAAHYLHREQPGHTLEATSLVSELYIRLFSSEPIEWKDRAHFFALTAQLLRRILVDHARAAHAEKRGGNSIRVSLTAADGVIAPMDRDVLELDEALKRLEALDPRAAAGVELRFFAGLKEAEIAEVLGISLVTLHRDWKMARAWLVSQLMPLRS